MYKLSDGAEEILESLWVETEEKKRKPDLSVLRDDPSLNELIDKGYIDLDKENFLTAAGLKEAEKCIRRHRLAERLLTDILDVKGNALHEASCKFEHGLHYGLEDSICTLLGHPTKCIHGKPIPPGECCKKAEKVPQQLIVPLKELRHNETARISYINTQDQDSLKKLLAMGILPGNTIKMLHRFPSFVFEMGNANFAIDKDLAENIHVMPLKGIRS